MDTGRLGDVRRHENKNRKFMCILNNMVKSRWDIVADSLNREQNEMGVKLEKAGTLWRRKHVQQRVLQQCLKMRRESLVNSSACRYGSYGGKPLYAFSREMDKFITDNHPKKRRQRKVKQALLESIEHGKILPPDEIPKRMDKFFSSWKEKKAQESSKHTNFLLNLETGGKTFKNKSIPPIRGLVNNFHKFTLDDEEENDVKSKESDVENKDVVLLEPEGKEKVELNKKDGTSSDKRRVLKLPPVQTSKAMISMSHA